MSDPKAPKTIELDLLNEVVTIELDELEEDATNLILVLNESECKVWVWTKLAQEYWQRGYHDEAEKIALAAITSEWCVTSSTGTPCDPSCICRTLALVPWLIGTGALFLGECAYF
jgi:RNA polymerase-associated protein CTR9